MNLKEAREIARKVGATIEEKDGEERPIWYLVRLGVIRIGSNGTRENITFSATSPHSAAAIAVVETGKAAIALANLAKQVYVDSDLIFGEVMK